MVTIQQDTGTRTRTYRCVICKGMFKGWGNNPSPVMQKGECCNDCNQKVVVKARLRNIANPARSS